MRRIVIRVLFAFMILVSATGATNPGQDRYGPPVDIVFCLDLSGSTNGLLVRMRDHIWDYVHLLSTCNPKVDFRIGFIGFARPSFGKENYYIKVFSDLTHDIEGLTNELLKLRPQIEKGDQFVGQALRVCADHISWNERPDAVKIVFLAGNGLVETGGEHYSKPLQTCVDKGIIVNSIFLLNNPVMGEQAGWENIARLGKGKYASMQVKFEYFENLGGFDMEKLFSLNRKLNETYRYYGPMGNERWKMQRAVDQSIYKANTEGYRYRLQFRISDLYLNKNSDWDLVDLESKNPLAVASVDRTTLPDSLKFMNESDLRANLIVCRNKRNEIVAEIQKLFDEKEQLVVDKNLQTEKNMKTFDITTIHWLSDILLAKGYTLNN
ncbi:MAG: VWA domain-containing protein [Bacteroidetes bacterium]|nr:VWA domain-containing protein [Bacteroidota bacterium]